MVKKLGPALLVLAGRGALYRDCSVLGRKNVGWKPGTTIEGVPL